MPDDLSAVEIDGVAKRREHVLANHAIERTHGGERIARNHGGIGAR